MKQQPPDDPRKAAWQILLSWETGNGALEVLRENHFRSAGPDPRDKALITELTQGTIRHLLQIDHTIRANLDRPDLSLPLPVLTAMRLGVYQLLYLSRIPAHAAVMETVQVIKESRYRKFSALVNAVLRKISRSGHAPVPFLEDDPGKHLEISTSMPRWLVDHLTAALDVEEALVLLKALNRSPALCLRVNTAKTNRNELLSMLENQGVTATQGKLAPEAVFVRDRISIGQLKPFTDGLCTVQDEGAQLIAPLLGPFGGEAILDACAAPGGKTSHLAELMHGRGIIAASDKSLRRVRLIVQNMQRLCIKGVKLTTADLTTRANPFTDEAFDRILLDVPCSGTGVLRRHPEGKWKKDLQTISAMAAKQYDLLVSVKRNLKPGGRMLYTTCSLLEEENEHVVDRFMASWREMVRLDMREQFPGMRKDFFTERGELRLWPHIHDCDGFYACLLEKR